ncbi:IBR domain, a half RING-finger domain [Teratosphaeria destructans]|uniref:IBR domain, a half RING-finger domain n=1 Tax=Teratosphaeria destructans TaxID=418781 RepID=A0A9W7W0A5_9PEZI|nr:IBR domain, a half RING-finger domain [Teratosphaeria destructans]
MASSSRTDTCTLCLETQTVVMHDLQNLLVCEDCLQTQVIPRFYAAIQHEYNYPPEIAPRKPIDEEQFALQLGADFLKRYAVKKHEYRTPYDDRIYCPHKVLLADVLQPGEVAEHKIALASAETATAEVSGEAVTECGAMAATHKDDFASDLFTCHHCMGEISISEIRAKAEANAEADQSNRFEGMVRGVDYQLCPKCRIPVQLWDGCNHMECGMCGASFCWICGQEQAEDSDHWLPGGCPRYGAAGAPNAHFDELAESRLDGPADGETWLSLPVRTIQNYLTHDESLQAELEQPFEFIGDGTDDAQRYKELAGAVNTALYIQFGQIVEPPPPEIGLDGYYAIWLDSDVMIRVGMRRHPRLVQAIRAHAPILTEALDFYMAHRDEFETFMLAHLAANPPPPREMGLDAPPGPDATPQSLQAIGDRASQFMRKAIVQILGHPDNRALDDNAESLYRMALDLRVQIWRMIGFVPQDRGRARIEGWERAFLSFHLSEAQALGADIANERVRSTFSRENFPLLAEALDFYDRHHDDFLEQL